MGLLRASHESCMIDPLPHRRGPLRARARAWLTTQVRAALSPHRGALEVHRAALQALAEDRDQLSARAAALDRAADRLRADLSLYSRRSFSLDMTLDQVWRRHPGVRGVFARHHLPACDGCSVRFDETLEEACAAYGIDRASLLAALDALFQAEG